MLLAKTRSSRNGFGISYPKDHDGQETLRTMLSTRSGSFTSRLKTDVSARILGSALVIVGYFVILHVNVLAGVIINLTADLLSLPYFIRTKTWDVVVMISFMSAVSLSKIFSVHF